MRGVMIVRRDFRDRMCAVLIPFSLHLLLLFCAHSTVYTCTQVVVVSGRCLGRYKDEAARAVYRITTTKT